MLKQPETFDEFEELNPDLTRATDMEKIHGTENWVRFYDREEHTIYAVIVVRGKLTCFAHMVINNDCRTDEQSRLIASTTAYCGAQQAAYRRNQNEKIAGENGREMCKTDET